MFSITLFGPDSIMGVAVRAHMGNMLSHSLTAADMTGLDQPQVALWECVCVHDAKRHTRD